MSPSLAAEFVAKCKRALGALKTDLPLESVIPILRDLEPLREAAFGPKGGPCISFEWWRDRWRSYTSVPDADYNHQADIPPKIPESEVADLRAHWILVVENWLNWAEVQRESPDPAEMVLESLRWFLSLAPFELVQRAAGVGRFDLLPLFKLSHPRGATIERRGGMGEVVPGPSAIDEFTESLLAGPMGAMGVEVSRRWADLSAGIAAWRDEIRDARLRWEHDRLRDLRLTDNLRAVFGDELIEQTERLRMDAGALVRLIERARGAESKPAEPEPTGGVCVPGDGLFPDGRCFIWGGHRYERLTTKMVDILRVFVEQFEAGFPIVNLQTIEFKTEFRFDGAFVSQAFKQNRRGEPPIHPVAAVIETVGRGEYRLVEPQKLKI